ncbi:MAG: serine hydrolase [Flavobacteriales bacterium]|nr:serine hydrolase [Flavobacteriales bacterium]
MVTRTLSALTVGLVCASSTFAQKAPDLKELDAYIADAVVKFDQPGLAVGIVQGGRLVWSKGYGKLDLAKSDPVTANSLFYCASISKAFTACAVGLLVDDGKLDWNAPVRQYMPEFNTPLPYVTDQFLVKDLLCHRSGWITFDGDLLWYGTNYTQKEILARHAHEPMTLPFRDEFGYSNLMFIAAAQLVERVSGMTWDQFITTRIFRPLGMDRSRVETADLAGMSDVALPHVRKGQDPSAPQKSMPYQALQGADGACGVISTVTDLAKWDAMWADEGKANGNVFIEPNTFGMITTSHLAMGDEGAGLGWFIGSEYGTKIITHSGGMPGFVLNHAVAPEQDLAVIALGNGESSSVFAVTNKILNAYLGDGKLDPVANMLPRLAKRKEREAARVAARVNARVQGTTPTAAATRLQGTFTDKVYGTASIVDDGGVPVLSFQPAKELFTGKLVHWHYDTWEWEHADPFLEPGYITFEFDADHNVTGFKIDLHSPDFHFYKLHFEKQ